MFYFYSLFHLALKRLALNPGEGALLVRGFGKREVNEVCLPTDEITDRNIHDDWDHDFGRGPGFGKREVNDV